MGDHKPDFKTHTDTTHMSYAIDGGNAQANRALLKSKMQSAQFSLGNANKTMGSA